MLDYLFFNQSVADQFIEFLEQKGCDWQQQNDPMLETIVIQTPEEIEDALWDALDQMHETLSVEDQQLLEKNETDNTAAQNDQSRHAAGIYIQLASGQQTIARVDPDTVNRILDVISMAEFNAFIETIVSSVEKPNDAPLCNKPLPGKKETP